MPYKDYNKRLEFRKTHREEINAYQREYRRTHPEKIKTISKKYTNTHKNEIKIRSKKWSLKTKYGLSITEFDNLLLSQDNRCAICKEPLDLQNPKNVNIDHNHLTGKVRGILCLKCNVAIGLLRDNPEYVYNAYKYLKERDSK